MALREHGTRQFGIRYGTAKSSRCEREFRERKENRIRRVTKGDSNVGSNSLVDARPKLISLADLASRRSTHILEECISIGRIRRLHIVGKSDAGTRVGRAFTRKSSFLGVSLDPRVLGSWDPAGFPESSSRAGPLARLFPPEKRRPRLRALPLELDLVKCAIRFLITRLYSFLLFSFYFLEIR